MSAPLPSIFAALAPVLDHWGYVAAGGVLLLEDFGVGAAGTAAIASFSLPGGLFADVAPPVLKEWRDQAMIPPSHVRDHPGEQRNGQSR